MLHQKKKVQQESLKAYMAAELNFWYKTPAIVSSFREEKNLSLSKVFEYQVTLLQLDTSYCFFI